MQFFQLKSLEQFTSIFSDSFWTETVLQLVQAEPAIEYAISTLSLVHENRLKESVGVVYDQECALRHYNRAIKALTQNASQTSARSMEIQIVSCLIFYNFEALVGHLGTASELFGHGIRLLNDILRKEGRPTPPIPSVNDTLLTILLTQFHRLHLQINIVFRGPTLIPLPYNTQSESIFKTPFDSLEDAKIAMEHLCLSFMQSTLCAADKELNTKRLNTWNLAFDSLLRRTPHTPATLRAIAQLRSLERRLQIELKSFPDKADTPNTNGTTPSPSSNTSSTTGPPDSPEIRRLHNEIVDFSAIALSNPSSSSNAAELVFTPDVAIIPALCSVIKSCHDPHIRRKALNLCKSANRIEGVWPSALAARIMERYIESVEGGFDGSLSAGTELSGEQTKSLNVSVVVHDVDKEAYVRYACHGEDEGLEETVVWT